MIQTLIRSIPATIHYPLRGARSGSCAAAAGATTPGTARPPVAAGATRLAGNRAADSGSSCFQVSRGEPSRVRPATGRCGLTVGRPQRRSRSGGPAVIPAPALEVSFDWDDRGFAGFIGTWCEKEQKERGKS
jgi:hypothetical protein